MDIQKDECFTEKQIKKAQKLEAKKQKYLAKYGVSIDEVNSALNKKQQGKLDEKKTKNSGEIAENNSSKNQQKNRKKSQKNQEKQKNLLFIHYFKRYKWRVVSALILSILIAFLGFSSAPITREMSDAVFMGQWYTAMLWALGLCGVLVLCEVAKSLSQINFARLSLKTSRDMRDDISRRVINTQSSAYRRLTTGEIVQRTANEPNNYVKNIKLMWDSFFSLLTTIGYVAYFFILNIWIGLMTTGVMAIDAILRTVQREGRAPRAMRNTLIKERQTSAITEFVRGSDDVKSLNLKRSMFSALSRWNVFDYNSNMNESLYTTTFMRARIMMVSMFSCAMLILGIYMISVGEITVGAFVILIRYYNAPLSFSFLLGNISINLQDAKISAKRMQKIFAETEYPQEKFGDKELQDFEGTVEFKNVTFGYDEQIALDDVSFVAPAHKTLGIVGKSGEGKSTILSLINRLIDCDSGEILLDGVKNTTLTEQSLRQNVGMVPQSPYIFNTTIRQNLLYAKPDATEDELNSALKSAQFYDFVMDKPDKLDTFVGEGGITLSGGQRQRLAIARAFLTECKVLMLDEATSALDNQNQEGIKEVINRMKQKCTFIIVAHRLSTIVDCDNIIVLDNHKIVAQGKHPQLLKSCKTYKDLYLLEKNKALATE